MRSRLAGPIAGPVLHQLIRREEKRLVSGWTYQPPSFVEKRNWEPQGDTVGAGSWEPLPQPE
jgi:hypothetical protein